MVKSIEYHLGCVMKNVLKFASTTLAVCGALYAWYIRSGLREEQEKQALVTETFSDLENRGQEAFENGDYETAMKEWMVLAEYGHADAATKVGHLYFKGLGVPQDYFKAAKWYQQAGNGFDGDGLYHLGTMYERGLGYAKNQKEAVELYRRGALMHHTLSIEALLRLGLSP